MLEKFGAYFAASLEAEAQELRARYARKRQVLERKLQALEAVESEKGALQAALEAAEKEKEAALQTAAEAAEKVKEAALKEVTAAAAAEKSAGPTRTLCAFAVDADEADVVADEPIFDGEDVVGFVTSGGYAHYSEQSVALGFVPTEMAIEGRQFTIEILGDRRPARIITTPLVDPDGARMRG